MAEQPIEESQTEQETVETLEAEETPASSELSKEDLWNQILSDEQQTPASVKEPEEATEPEVESVDATPTDSESEEVVEPELAELEPKKPSKLEKRLHDQSQFIETLKGENHTMRQQLAQMQEQLTALQSQPPPKEMEPETPAVSHEDALKAVLADLPEDLRQEAEAFPELMASINHMVEKKLESVRGEVMPDLTEVRKERQQRQVQQALQQRHQLANNQLGISNAADLDFNDPDFARWVLSVPRRKAVVTNFSDPDGFVDLLKGFLYEHPEAAKRGEEVPAPVPVQNNVAQAERRKTASTVVPRRSPPPAKPQRPIQTNADKEAYWEALMSED
jgi:hypothetical protein